MEWLDRWLKVPFYDAGERCRKHEKHYNCIYCVACMERPVCRICWNEGRLSDQHQGDRHRILEVRTASNRAAIRVADMAKNTDVSEIQVYKINGYDILHLTPDVEKAATNAPYCITCRRKLMKSGHKFCSIACKYEKVGRAMELKCETNSGSGSGSPSSGIDFEIGAPHSSATKLPNPSGNTSESKDKTANNATNDSDQCRAFVSLRKRSRKGIPRRSPLK